MLGTACQLTPLLSSLGSSSLMQGNFRDSLCNLSCAFGSGVMGREEKGKLSHQGSGETEVLLVFPICRHVPSLGLSLAFGQSF